MALTTAKFQAAIADLQLVQRTVNTIKDHLTNGVPERKLGERVVQEAVSASDHAANLAAAGLSADTVAAIDKLLNPAPAPAPSVPAAAVPVTPGK